MRPGAKRGGYVTGQPGRRLFSGLVGVAGDKARVLDVVFAAQAFEFGLT